MAPPVLRIVERDLRVFARLWHAFVFSIFVVPVLFLAAMGVGLGGLIDDQRTVEGLSYLHFVAPGLLMASVMQGAAGESLWAVLGGVKWDGRYIAMVATPLTSTDVYIGALNWVVLRTLATSSAFLLVAALLGGIISPWGVLAVPIAVLCALAFAAPLSAWAIGRDTDAPFAMIMRIGVMPLFLFSGTFFPISSLPAGVRPIAWLSPLWHGVELARAATTADVSWPAALAHVAVLVGCVVVGAAWGRRTFAARLTS
ncbi:MAG: type transporter [Actinomycetia bacterium]|nr:type transporter [Actinomycetes bacterium]